MNAVDTNILVRFLVNDDKKQAQVANEIINKAESTKEPLYVPILVILELIWVLGAAYAVKREDILLAINNLLVMPAFTFEKQSAVRDFLTSANQSNFDLADLLIAHSAVASNCSTTLTFDKRASKFELFTRLAV